MSTTKKPDDDLMQQLQEAALETNVKAIELKDLWRRYKASGDGRARERLVVAYSPLVKYVAGRIWQRSDFINSR